jgi:membrane associated rhomboid family serine protease
VRQTRCRCKQHECYSARPTLNPQPPHRLESICPGPSGQGAPLYFGLMFPVSDVIPSRSRPVVTIALIALNTLVFLYELQLDRRQLYDLAHALGVVPAEFYWPRAFTSAFLHDGWIHFGGNMLYLWIFGDNVEDAIGHTSFAAFYLIAAALAAAAHAALNPASLAPLIGASGAVAAIMGVYFVLYPRSQVLTAIFLVLYLDLIEVPAIIFLGVWLAMQLVAGLASMGAGAADGGVAIGAHLAGFLVGLAAGLALRLRGKTRAWG